MEYTNPEHSQFVRDMEAAGLEVEHYRGRFGWEGPAVRVDDLQDALGATKVECQVEPTGRGYIVYPRTYPHRADVDRWVRPPGGGPAYPILRRERDA